MQKSKSIFLLFTFIYFNQQNSYSQSQCECGIKQITLANQENTQKIVALDSSITIIKEQLQDEEQSGYANFINVSSFIDAAISTSNNLRALFYKESYRNKISSLNNPTSNELGFNLELEIHTALKPLLEKCRKTDVPKFENVLKSFLHIGNKGTNGLVTLKDVFGSILGLVGTLTLGENKITSEDFETFINQISKYFTQYERLNNANVVFSQEIEKLKIKLHYIQEDIKSLLIDLTFAFDNTISRQELNKLNSEDIMMQYFDQSKLKEKTNTDSSDTEWNFPVDAIGTCKEITTSFTRLYDEYYILYNNNFIEIKAIITDARQVSTSVDQVKINKTLKEIEDLFSESKDVDINSLRLKTLNYRLEKFVE